MTELLTTKQVQEFLHVDRTTIYRMVEGGQLPAVRVGKQWRFAKSEVERWLSASRAGAAPAARKRATTGETTAGAPGGSELRTLLPSSYSQLIQDTFAELLGVMVLVTDMQGRPVTEVSNPCGFFAAVMARNPRAVEQCVRTWQQLAGEPALEPKFSTSELDLLCARGLIRVGAELKGMVVLGGIAPEVWPPSDERVAAIAETLELDPDFVRAEMPAVYRLDRAAQARALAFVQRIADIFAHIIEDRGQARGA